MHVQHLSLTDFRSYPTAEVELGRGVTAFVGPNGQGKTNLVEALGYIATLGSHRVATDAPLVRAGAERATIRAAVMGDDRRMLAEIEINPGSANRARLNGSPAQRPREILGVLRTVLFAPEDLSLVKGDPSDRRRFIDELLVLRAPRYAGVRGDYDRIIKQRNALLKSARGGRSRNADLDLTTLDVWDEQLARVGGELLAARLALLAELEPLVEAAYTQVAPTGGRALPLYRSSISAEELPPSRDDLAALMAEALVESRRSELERGISLVGPHRDDITLQLGDLPAKGYASHGESWSFALALRLASYELLRQDERPGGDPVLVLDDVFAELDVQRRERLAAAVADAEQVLITAAVEGDVPEALNGVRFDVSAGHVERAA